MASASVNGLQSLVESLVQGAENQNCVKCLKLPHHPYLLIPCLHCCCRACLPAMQAEGKCPQCHELVIADVDKCQENYLGAAATAVQRAKEDPKNTSINCNLCKDEAPAARFCRNCKVLLCDHHVTRHKQDGRSSHNLEAIEAFIRSETHGNLANMLRTVPQCKDHERQPLQFHCECDELLCSFCCIAGPHQHHKRSDIAVAQKDQRAHLTHALAVTAATSERPSYVDMLRQSLEAVHATLDQLKLSKSQAAHVLVSSYEEIIKALQQQMQRDRADLEAAEASQKGALTSQQETLSSILSGVLRAVTLGEQVAASSDPMDVVALSGVIIKRILSFNTGEWPLSPCVSGRLVYVADEQPLLDLIPQLGRVRVIPVGEEEAAGDASGEPNA